MHAKRNTTAQFFMNLCVSKLLFTYHGPRAITAPDAMQGRLSHQLQSIALQRVRAIWTSWLEARLTAWRCVQEGVC